MIPHKKEHEFQSSGLTNEVKAYTFQMNSHMASMLSDTLYSDKPTACQRELVANAYDSHRDAGNPDPPIIHMCTALEPWWSIEDFGVGLDETEFEEVFTSYGGSTKRETNATVGKFGLGSKVFFAYTSQATVICTKDGVRRTFSVFKDKTGMPSHNKLGEEQTDAPNGVKISFGVLPGDCKEFQEAGKQVYRRYDPAPIIEGMDDFVPEPYETIMEGTGWVLRKEESRVYYRQTEHNRPYAIQGNIAYPISSSEVKSALDDGLDFMLHVPFDIEFPIGQLEIVNSREALSYNQQTIDNIAARLSVIHDEIADTIVPRIFTECTNKWEATKALGTFTSTIDNPDYKKLIRNVAQWNGKQVEEHMDLPWSNLKDTENALDRAVYAYEVNERRFAMKSLNIAPAEVRNHNNIILYGNREYLIVVAKGDEKRVPSRFKRYMKETYGEAVRRGRYYSGEDTYPIVIFIKAAQAISIINFTKMLNGHEWHMFDKLVPEYPPVKRAAGIGMGTAAVTGPVNRRVMVFNGRSGRNWGRDTYKEQWDDATVNTNTLTTGYYVDLRQWRVKSDSAFIGHRDITFIQTTATDLGILTNSDKIYGVPGGQKNELAALTGWKELTAEIDAVQKAWEVSATAKNDITYHKVFDDTRRIGEIKDYLTNNNITDTDIIKAFLTLAPLDTSRKIEQHVYLANDNMHKIFDQTIADDITNKYKAINDKYPMLKHMDLRAEEADDIKEYVKLVSTYKENDDE